MIRYRTANHFSNFRPSNPAFFTHRQASQHPPMAKIRPFCTVDAPGPNSSTKSTSPGGRNDRDVTNTPSTMAIHQCPPKLITSFWRIRKSAELILNTQCYLGWIPFCWRRVHRGNQKSVQMAGMDLENSQIWESKEKSPFEGNILVC